MSGKNRTNRQRRKERRIITPGHVEPGIDKPPDLTAIEAQMQGDTITLFKEPHVRLPVLADEAVTLQLTALTQLVNVIAHEVLELGERVAALEGVAVEDVGALKTKVESLTARLEKALEESRSAW